MSNKWTRPDAPPGPLYFNGKERDFVKQINDEIIERIINEQILYYAIDENFTNYHSVYGEAIEKNFLPPIKINALVAWEGLKTSVNKYSDSIQKIKVGFHKRRLVEDQDCFVRLGDFVCYGDSHYQIIKLSEDKQLFGQIDHKFEITADCIRAREGSFDAS